jgi:hypothetical protein
MSIPPSFAEKKAEKLVPPVDDNAPCRFTPRGDGVLVCADCGRAKPVPLAKSEETR